MMNIMKTPLSSYLATSSTEKKHVPQSVVFVTSGLGGCLGWAVVHPANTVAVRMSLAAMNGKKFSFATMVKENGLASVYDGLTAGILRQVFYATARFGLFETFRDYAHEIRGKTDFAARNHLIVVCSFISVVIGAITGGMAAYISCPMEVAVVRLSNDVTLPLDERRNYKGVVDTATRIVKEEGIGAFWRGSGPFVTRAMMVGVFQVATLDQFKVLYCELLGQRRDSIANVFSSAMTSGLIYSIATMPLEATKNRMASQKPDPVTHKLPYTGTLQTLRLVTKQEGFFAFYNGFLPYYIRCGGHTVTMFIFVQLLRDFYVDNM